MAGGRPTKFTKKLADSICAELADGKSMRTICKEEKMPAMATIFRWLREKEEFREQYETAKQECADAMIEDILDIADNQVEQPILVEGKPIEIDGKAVTIKDSPSVQHAKLRVDARKWVASKLKPKKYGDRVTQEHVGEGGGPIKTKTLVVTGVEPANTDTE